jgi:hypothetical protein
MIIEVLANNVLILTQEVTTNIKGFVVLDSLNFIDSLSQSPVPQALESILHLRQVAAVEKTLNLSVSQTLTFQQSVSPRVYDLSVTSWLLMTQDATLESQWPSVNSQLALSQTVEVSKAKGAYSQLVLTQSVSYTHTKNITVSQTLTMTSSAVGFLPDYYWQNGTFVVEAP